MCVLSTIRELEESKRPRWDFEVIKGEGKADKGGKERCVGGGGRDERRKNGIESTDSVTCAPLFLENLALTLNRWLGGTLNPVRGQSWKSL